VFKRSDQAGGERFWRGTASASELFNLLARFVGLRAAGEAFADYARQRGLERPEARREADAELVHFVEKQLAGVIGAASAHIMLASAVKQEALTLDEVRAMLDDASQIIVYSHRLEQKSQELERATQELRAANERLKELDRLKDEFVATVSHELRTPLTSIRAFSQILYDTPDMPGERRAQFLAIITKETDRLTRLINQVLDLARIEAGNADWRVGDGVIEATKARGFLVSKQSYGDFELRGDIWVTADSNGGFLFRITKPEDPGIENGYELNINDKRADQTGRTGSIVNVAKPLVQYDSGGKWTTVVITAKGPHIVATLNGIKTAEVDDTKYGRGPVSLQAAGGIVRYRNVEIRELR